MKRHNTIILAAMLISLVIISFAPVNENTIVKNPTLLQDGEENITLISTGNETEDVKILENPIISKEYFETLNGMLITEEKYANFEESEITIDVDIPFEGKTISLEITIPGNRVWSYDRWNPHCSKRCCRV